MINFLKSAFGGLVDKINSAFKWLGELLTNLFQSLLDALEPILLFFSGLWYFITQLLYVVVLVLRVILGLIGVLFGIIGGFFNTIFSFLSWSGSASSINPVFSGGFEMFFNAFTQMGGNIIAGVLSVFVWFVAVFVLFKVIGSNA